MTPVFGHGHLRLYLLSLLAERPMHGYELIQALSDRFGGTYIPSAGTIYPRLAKLGEEGLVSREADGRKTVYSITDAGRAELERRQGELDDIEDGVTASVRSLADEVRSSVADAMRTLRADLAAVARETGGTRPAAATPRAEPTPAEASENAPADAPSTPDAAAHARREVHEAELALWEFRNAMRKDLRAKAAAGVLTPGTAARLRAELEALRAEFELG
jgi:DNA-binding PadR family transcriptional regulator